MVLLLVGVALLCASSDGAPDSRPNFLILFVDDLGYNEINLGEHAPATGGKQ